jgi:hypothetical protein
MNKRYPLLHLILNPCLQTPALNSSFQLRKTNIEGAARTLRSKWKDPNSDHKPRHQVFTAPPKCSLHALILVRSAYTLGLKLLLSIQPGQWLLRSDIFLPCSLVTKVTQRSLVSPAYLGFSKLGIPAFDVHDTHLQKNGTTVPSNVSIWPLPHIEACKD